MSGASPPGLVIQHEDAAPPALLGSWLTRRRLDFELVRADRGALPSRVSGRPFVVVLGSDYHVYDDSVPWLKDELRLVERALEEAVPTFGICFGSQVLASVVGGEVRPAAKPEVGWITVEPERRDLVPRGPWPGWHSDAFATPPGAELLADGEHGCQAFRIGSAIGFQFHPEASVDVFRDWIRKASREELTLAGRDAAGLLEEAEARGAESAVAAALLFDRTFAALGVPSVPVASAERS